MKNSTNENGVINLKKCSITNAAERDDIKFCFKITPPDHSSKEYYFYAKDATQMVKWVSEICDAILIS